MEQVARRTISQRLAAAWLGLLYHILPRPLYNRFYTFAFPRYKAWMRRRYRWRALKNPTPDLEKIEAVYRCLEYSLVGWQGMEATYDCATRVLTERIPGDLVECGVAQGGSALLLALARRRSDHESRILWLFDSFEGLPQPTVADFHDGRTGTHVRPLPKGSCMGTIEEVSRLLFDRHGVACESVKLVKGWFQETLPITRGQISAIALLRLDGDWYESTKVCLENLFEKVSAGGYVIVDDYFSCYGCKRATDEFLAARKLSLEIVADGRGGAFFQKQV